jgi:hypothetical protein
MYMKFSIQYIPLNKIDTHAPIRMTQHIRKLRNVLWDSAHLLAVRKNRKDGRFIVVGGHDRLRYLRSHTTKIYAPCILDESKEPSKRGSLPAWIRNFRNRNLPESFPKFHPEKVTPAGWSIIRTFVKEESRFQKLTRVQQVKVLLLGVRYKRTVITSMKAMVDDMAHTAKKE